jgi:hypothetical protein
VDHRKKKKEEEERRKMKKQCIPYVKGMNMTEFTEEVRSIESERRRMQELLDFINWISREHPRIIKVMEMEKLLVKICYAGKERVVSVRSYLEILMHELDRLQSVYGKVLCRNQVNVKEEWKHLRKEIEVKKTVSEERNALLEDKEDKLFVDVLSHQIKRILEMDSKFLMIGDELVQIVREAQSAESNYKTRWVEKMDED